MTRLDLYSEPFSPNGNVTSEGVLNQLGRPDFDIHSLLIRETVQNSWDARGRQWGVRYSVDGWTLSAAQEVALREMVFAELPERLPLGPVLRGERLATDDEDLPGGLRLLAISDRGTIGLGGPTRADVASGPGVPRDFVDFLRNVGFPPDKPMTGGTYGYGKAAAYIASRARTIVVHTRWPSPEGLESRFMAAGLGEAHVTSDPVGANGMRTGRHWWGRLDGGFVEPVTGEGADQAAAAIGMPAIPAGETGTTVCIVDPYLAGSDLGDTVAFMVAAMLWNFWPKMLPDEDGNTPITFSASAEGVAVRVPSPRDYPPLEGFVAAYDAAQSDVDVDDPMLVVTHIGQLRPVRRLGRIAVAKFPVKPRLGIGASHPPAPFEGPARHVALMRQVRLVVRYVEGPRLPVDAIQYGGVFISDPGVDDLYKASEPPSHDEWRASILQNRTDRSVILSADREIRAVLDRFAAPVPAGAPPRGGGAVAELARDLAALLPGLDGPGAETQDRDAPGGTRLKRRRARVRILGTSAPEMVGDTPFIRVTCTVEPVEGTEGTLVGAKARVALDDGALETDPPAGAAGPSVRFWIAPDGRRIDGERVLIDAADRGTWTVHVAVVPDLATGVEIEPVSA